MRRLLAFVLSFGLILAPQAYARAQTAAYAEIIAVDSQNFPQVDALLDVYNANGSFVTDLAPTDLTAYEDGQPRAVDSVTRLNVPVQIVAAINPGPALDLHDNLGIAPFQRIVETLGNWVNAQPADSQDDLSLVSLSGSLITHASVTDWFVSLNSFKPDFRRSTPNLNTLTSAIDTATLPTKQDGMKRAILFITPAIDDPNIDNTIAPLIRRAVESKVRVFVWFVGPEGDFVTASANAFKSLALQTNGSFTAFSGIEPLPDLNVYFEPLRYIYSLTYTSSLISAGDHSLGIYVQTPQGQIPALDKTFNVDIQPPNPIFISPPLQITRQPPEDDPYNPDILEPAQQRIQIIVEFPDGHKRNLTRTTLYADGAIVDENIYAPFDTFTWDLSVYDESGQHTIIVEAEDALGLKKSSISIPVTLTVVRVPRGVQALLARYSTQLVLGAIAIAGLALVGILLRSRTGSVTQPNTQPRNGRRQKFEDPLTQPVAALTEAPVSATKKSKTQPRRPNWLQGKPARVEEAPAYLVRLTNGGEPASVAPIAVTEKDMTFGTDPVQSMRVLDDLSISPLHARIKRMEDGVFVIYDHGSVAGTWVNFDPVPREGIRLAHGDRIHFGQMIYRFDLKQPPAVSEPRVVSKKNPES